MDDNDLLEPAEVARLIKRPASWFAKLRMTDSGPKFLKVGGKVRYRRQDIEEWLAVCERASSVQTHTDDLRDSMHETGRPCRKAEKG